MPDQLPGNRMCSSSIIKCAWPAAKHYNNVQPRDDDVCEMHACVEQKLKVTGQSRLFEPQDLVSRLFGVQPLDVPQFHVCKMYINTAYYVSIFWGVMLLHLLVVLPVKLVSTSDRERSNIMWCTVHISLKVLALIHIILISMYNIHTCAAWYIPWNIQFDYDIYDYSAYRKERKKENP